MPKYCALIIASLLALTLAACDRLLNQEADFSRGGTELLLEVNTDALRRERLNFVADEMAEALRTADPRIITSGRGVAGETAIIRLRDIDDTERASAALQTIPSASMLSFQVQADGQLLARFTNSAMTEAVHNATTQASSVIEQRLAAIRIRAEVMRVGANRIAVKVPQGADIQRVVAMLTTSGRLGFHLVREVSPLDAAAGDIPPGSILVQPYPGFAHSAEVVERRPRLTGEHLQSVTPFSDPHTGDLAIAFQLNQAGARQFCELTHQHAGERFAVLIDDKVITAPVINEPICGGNGQISGSFTAESARDLALVLSAGGLPAPLTIIETKEIQAD